MESKQKVVTRKHELYCRNIENLDSQSVMYKDFYELIFCPAVAFTQRTKEELSSPRCPLLPSYESKRWSWKRVPGNQPKLGMAATTGQLIGFSIKVLFAQTQLGELLSRKENRPH